MLIEYGGSPLQCLPRDGFSEDQEIKEATKTDWQLAILVPLKLLHISPTLLHQDYSFQANQ
jgi:hypothetical protein